MALKQLLTNLSNSSTPVDSSAYPTQASHLEGVTFNQRSFRFGEGRQSDQSGGGFSREPFIGNPRALFGVDTNDSDLSDANDSLSGLENTLSVVDGVTNGLVRGGIVTALKRSLTDTQRITNFYVSERGFGFLLKQTLLHTTNPSIEDGSSTTDYLGLRRNRQFNPLGTNLLAQSLVNFSGVHFDRAGILPIWPEEAKYEKIVSNPEKANNIGNLNTLTGKTNTFEGNRLLTLFGAHIQDDEVQGVEGNKETKTPKTGFGRLAAQGKDLVQSITGKNSPMLYEYGAGPGSTYGIGRTSIRKFEDTTNSPNIQKTKARTARIGDTITPDIGTINYLRLIGRPANDYNFRKTREYRVGTGDPGVKPNSEGRNPYIGQKINGGQLNYNHSNNSEASYNNPLLGASSKVDKINMLDIFKGDGNFAVPEANDLIKFRFEAVNNDDPTKSDVMIFRAFLDDLKDNYNANFNEFSYNGRGETFYTYNSFKRDINFSFKVAAQTRQEMMPLYRKLNYLASQTAPEYQNGRMRAGFVRLSIGSWCDRIPGFIQNVSLSWQKDYPWEIAIDSAPGGQDRGMLVLPHVLDVSVSFLPVHNFTPQRSVTESPFILPHENNRKLNDEQKWYALDSADTTTEALRLGSAKLMEQFYPEPEQAAPIPPSTSNEIIIDTEELDFEEYDEEEEEVYSNNQIVGAQGPVPQSGQETGGYSPFIN